MHMLVAVAEKEGTLQNYLDAFHTKKIADNSIQARQPARAGFKVHEKKGAEWQMESPGNH